MENNISNNKNYIKKMSIFLGGIAFLLIILFVMIIYFSAPTSPQSYNSKIQTDTLIYDNLNRIKLLNSDLYQLEKLIDHLENDNKINNKKIEYFLSNYQGIIQKANEIKESIDNNPNYNKELKKYFGQIVEDIQKSFKIVSTCLDQIPIASPLDLNHNTLFIVSKFGMRNHPINHTMKMHAGIDLRAKVGSHILATASGRVIKNGTRGGYGYSCEIQHKYGYSTVYAHMVRTTVTKGQWINKGDEIGFVGSTGLSQGPHLHYEVRRDNKPVNPVPYIFEGMSEEEYGKWVK